MISWEDVRWKSTRLFRCSSAKSQLQNSVFVFWFWWLSATLFGAKLWNDHATTKNRAAVNLHDLNNLWLDTPPVAISGSHNIELRSDRPVTPHTATVWTWICRVLLDLDRRTAGDTNTKQLFGSITPFDQSSYFWVSWSAIFKNKAGFAMPLTIALSSSAVVICYDRRQWIFWSSHRSSSECYFSSFRLMQMRPQFPCKIGTRFYAYDAPTGLYLRQLIFLETFLSQLWVATEV